MKFAEKNAEQVQERHTTDPHTTVPNWKYIPQISAITPWADDSYTAGYEEYLVTKERKIMLDVFVMSELAHYDRRHFPHFLPFTPTNSCKVRNFHS